jgi:hypothetical protein
VLGPALFVARAQWRGRFRHVAFVTLCLGVVGGVAMSLAAGAQRSASVVERYFDAGRDYHLQTFAGELTQAELRALPQTKRVHLSAYIGGVLRDPGNPLDGEGVNLIAADTASLDPTVRLLDGSAPDERDPYGAAVNEAFLRRFGAAVGDEVTLQLLGRDQRADAEEGRYDRAAGPRVTFEIVALVRTPDDVVLDTIEAPGGPGAYTEDNAMMVPASFYHERRREFLDFGAAFDVELHDPADEPAFRAAVARKAGGASPAFGPPRFGERRGALDTPVNVETTTLRILAAGVAIAGAIVGALLLRAEQRWHDADGSALRALGFDRRQLRTTALVRTAPAAVGSAVVAVAVAIALSGRYPVGLGRQLELDAGTHVNVAVLGIGAAAVLLVVVACASTFAAPSRTAVDARRARRTLAETLAQSGAPPAFTLGTHFAFEHRRGERGVPSRQAVAGGALTLVVVAAIATLSAGADRLHERPAERGWPWDVAIGNVNFAIERPRVAEILDDPRIEAATAAAYGEVRIEGRPVEVLAYDGAGSAPPAVLDGRLPRAPSEIALGARLLRRLDRSIGDTVTMSLEGSDIVELPRDVPPQDRRLRVVGVAVAPVLGETDLGEPGVVTLDALAGPGSVPPVHYVLARVAGDDPAAVVRDIDDDLTYEMVTDVIPARVASLRRVRLLPLAGLALAGVMGTTVLAYVLVAGVRAREREIGTLRAMGLSSSRLGRVVAWQGAALSTAMILIGVPLGVALGATVWRGFAHRLGVEAHAVVDPRLALLVPASLAVGALAALVAARRLRRSHVAPLLHVE